MQVWLGESVTFHLRDIEFTYVGTGCSSLSSVCRVDARPNISQAMMNDKCVPCMIGCYNDTYKHNMNVDYNYTLTQYDISVMSSNKCKLNKCHICPRSLACI